MSTKAFKAFQQTAGDTIQPTGSPGPDPTPDAFVIDDEVGICKFIQLTLSSLGVASESFQTADEAISALGRGHPDIIFLDIALNGSDAIDVIRKLGERHYSGLVQVMSGSNMRLLEDVRRVGARHGLNMRPPLEKPFRADAIREVIAAATFDHQPEATLSAAPMRRLSLEEALANAWLELWYQPKIDLRTSKITGAEGLIRCRHPVHGLVLPNHFLPQASDASLTALTELVVVQSLQDWNEMAELGMPLQVAINTSVCALSSAALPAVTRESRPKSDKWPGLILEVTEHEVVKDVSLVHEIATQLRIYGISLAIDDFGEGYSSFARLRELPFSELKLDRSFVDGCSDDARNTGICQAVIDLAHHFGAVAVAEGIERREDLDAVVGMGCDIGQGYYFARPMPKAEFLSSLGRSGASAQAPVA